jgi:HSP20 family protein
MTNLQETLPQSSNRLVSELQRLPDIVDQLFREGLHGPAPEPRVRSNLLETWESYWLQIALPTADVDTLRVQVVARKVMVGGKFRPPIIETATFLRHELPAGEFAEVFELPGGVDGDRSEARYSDGILTLRLPKLSYLKPKDVRVSSPK